MDSNHRNPKMTDLQSVPFNHSGTYPCLNKCVKNKYYYSGSLRTCQHLFILFSAHPDRNVDEAVRADRAADRRILCRLLGRGLLLCWRLILCLLLWLELRDADRLLWRVKARGDDGDAHRIAHRVVDGCTPDDVGLRVCGLLDGLSSAPVTLSSTPRAPSMLVSSSGEAMAALAASTAAFSPEASPMPIRADPALLMMLLTSAKSRLMRPGRAMRSEMPLTPWRRTSSAMLNACVIGVFLSTTCMRRSFGIVMIVSTCFLRFSMPSSALRRRFMPSN